ncbi:MAG: hypothetical protein ACRDRP_05945 [Pseudonocardiaceae bacterium]
MSVPQTKELSRKTRGTFIVRESAPYGVHLRPGVVGRQHARHRARLHGQHGDLGVDEVVDGAALA